MLSVFQAMSGDCVLKVDFEILLKDFFVTRSWFGPSLILEGLGISKKNVRAVSVQDKFRKGR
jgi:hypothetical protein